MLNLSHNKLKLGNKLVKENLIKSSEYLNNSLDLQPFNNDDYTEFGKFNC